VESGLSDRLGGVVHRSEVHDIPCAHCYRIYHGRAIDLYNRGSSFGLGIEPRFARAT
jgi:hypothetical protein